MFFWQGYDCSFERCIQFFLLSAYVYLCRNSAGYTCNLVPADFTIMIFFLISHIATCNVIVMAGIVFSKPIVSRPCTQVCHSHAGYNYEAFTIPLGLNRAIVRYQQINLSSFCERNSNDHHIWNSEVPAGFSNSVWRSIPRPIMWQFSLVLKIVRAHIHC